MIEILSWLVAAVFVAAVAGLIVYRAGQASGRAQHRRELRRRPLTSLEREAIQTGDAISTMLIGGLRSSEPAVRRAAAGLVDATIDAQNVIRFGPKGEK